MKELIKIQNLLDAPKNQYNKFGGFHYRSCEDILTGIKPLLLEYECYLIISDTIIVLGDRFYVQATVTITNKENKSVSVSALARESTILPKMSESQTTGTASSYARKYALGGLLAIDDTKDDDSNERVAQKKEGNNNPQSNDNLPWLNQFGSDKKTPTKEWTSSLSAITKHKQTGLQFLDIIKKVRTKFKVSKSIQTELESYYNAI